MPIPTAVIVAGIETAGAIAEALSKMSSSEPAPPAGLTGKSHWVTMTVFNQTQYEIVFQSSYFDSGRFWTAPTNVPPFESMTFSGCESDGSIMTGVSGGVQFSIAIPGNAQPFSAGFSNPEIGAYKASVVAGGTAQSAYNAIDNSTISDSIGPIAGTDTNGKAVTLNFGLVSSPGPEASVTVTQQVAGD
jgi:hypothetical protein